MNFKNILVLASIPAALIVIGVAGYLFSGIEKFYPNVDRVQSIYNEIKACPGDINKEKAEKWFSLQLEKEKALEDAEKSLNELIKSMADAFFLLAALSLWQGVTLVRNANKASNQPMQPTPKSGAADG